MVVITTIGGYFALGGTLKSRTFLYLALGTFLQSASANSFNQILEVEYDKTMHRTKYRPLCQNRLSPVTAIVSAVIVGVIGSYLNFLVSPLTSILGIANLLVYICLYTPIKRLHWINTWIGGITGSIPPVMGCVAALANNKNKNINANQNNNKSTTSPSKPFTIIREGHEQFWKSLLEISDIFEKWKEQLFNIPCVYMFLMMFFWQITHFMGISYKCGKDYAAAGYRMLSSENPRAAANQSVLHAFMLLPLCGLLPMTGLVPWWFSGVSLAINYLFLLRPALNFRRAIYEIEDMKKDENEAKTAATNLFYSSMLHLTLLFSSQTVAFLWDSLPSFW